MKLSLHLVTKGVSLGRLDTSEKDLVNRMKGEGNFSAFHTQTCANLFYYSNGSFTEVELTYPVSRVETRSASLKNVEQAVELFFHIVKMEQEKYS